jgi:type IV pilus assembly protein PilA
MKKNTGFTLIELLVVIAIIGILSSVVLASLNTARAKGSDAAIKGALAGARAQAELFYSNGNTYAGVCTTGTNNIKPQVDGAANTLKTGITAGAGVFAYDVTGVATGSAVCHDSAGGWAAIVSLKSPTVAASGWCVDSTGASKEATVLGATSTTCGA